MEALQQTYTNEVKTQTLKALKQPGKLEIIHSKFLPARARDMLIDLMDQQINALKLQHLSLWEGNHSANTDLLDRRISELTDKKEALKYAISQARDIGCNVNVDCTLDIKLE